MIRMIVGQNRIADRQIGSRLDRCKQGLATQLTAAGVDDGNGAVANNETDIGKIAFVLGIGFLMLPLVHEYAGRHFGYAKRRIGAFGNAGPFLRNVAFR